MSRLPRNNAGNGVFSYLRRAVARRRSARNHRDMSRIRLIKHESVPQAGSYEVRFPDCRPSVYHYFDDNPGRRSITEKMTSEEALQAAKTDADLRALRGVATVAAAQAH